MRCGWEDIILPTNKKFEGGREDLNLAVGHESFEIQLEKDPSKKSCSRQEFTEPSGRLFSLTGVLRFPHNPGSTLPAPLVQRQAASER